MTTHPWTTLPPFGGLLAVDMNNPPAPPSPFDEIVRNKKRVEEHRRLTRLLKQRFPGLPF